MIRDAWETLSRAFAVLRRKRLDREFDEEFATHLALLTDQFERRGLPRDEARRQAILQMGGLNPTRDLHRESRGLPHVERWMEAVYSVGKDLRHAARSLARARTFTLVCVVSLGVGMGAFVALATFVRAIGAPARGVDTTGLVELLVIPQGPLRAKAGTGAIEEWSYPDFEDLRRADTGIALTGWAMGISETPPAGDDDPARILTLYVSPNYFTTFGVSLAFGPGFDAAADQQSSTAPPVVVSHAYWRNRLGSDPDIVGKPLTFDGVTHVVAGVTPAEFRGHFNALDDNAPSSALFVPLERFPRLRADSGLRTNRLLDWVHLHGRLLPGVDLAQANTRVAATMAALARQYPASNEFKAASAEPYYSQGAANRTQMRKVFSVMLSLAGMVLLVVCVNISGMMLVRGAARERELSVREAVGASRTRLMQYLFFEAVWLAVIGGVLSVAVLFGLPALVARWLDTTVPPELDLDGAGIAVSASLCFAVSIVLGLLPAVRLSRPNIIAALKDDVAGGGLRVSRLQRAAAAMQVAIAVPFLVVSGAMLDRVRTADFGFDGQGLVAARVDPTAVSERTGAQVPLRTFRTSLQAASGVVSLTMGDGMPLDFTEREVRVSPATEPDFVSAHVTRVAEGYLDTVGARLLQGRAILAEDRSAGARVAVISEPLAKRLFPSGAAIGERLRCALEEGREDEFTIVGVTADFATAQLTTPRPQILLPLPDSPIDPVYLIARGAPSDESRLASAFENVARDLGVELIPSLLETWPGIVSGTTLVEKSLQDLVFESIAVAVAGAVVLALASLGVLGVIAFMVRTRTREIAVRMALGATRPRVVGLMMLDVMRLVAPGVAVGLAIGGVLIRVMSDVMGTPLTVGPTPLGAVEPLIYLSAAAVAIVVALAAGLPAARRAASIQPMAAMRSE